MAKTKSIATKGKSVEKNTAAQKNSKQPAAPVFAEKRQMIERRSKVNRRRQIDPTTCERDYSDAEVEFMHALDEYKRKNGRMFPTCSEILEVIRGLGYAKINPAMNFAAIQPTVETTLGA